jgi:hypothetical protein
MVQVSRGFGAAILCLVALLVSAVSEVGAQRATTSATFKSAVQLPGVVLPAGTYQFAVAHDRRSVVVSDADRRIVTTLMVVPTSRARRGDVVVMRRDTAGPTAEVVAMFLDGGRNGFEFVRPEAKN